MEERKDEEAVTSIYDKIIEPKGLYSSQYRYNHGKSNIQ